VGEQEIYGAPPVEAVSLAYVFFFVRVTYVAECWLIYAHLQKPT
jgi:hypothetical protein